MKPRCEATERTDKPEARLLKASNGSSQPSCGPCFCPSSSACPRRISHAGRRTAQRKYPTRWNIPHATGHKPSGGTQTHASLQKSDAGKNFCTTDVTSFCLCGDFHSKAPEAGAFNHWCCAVLPLEHLSMGLSELHGHAHHFLYRQ